MSRITHLLDRQLLAQLGAMRLRPRGLVEGGLAGQHRNPSRGFSAEFASHREYAAGDELRYLDWKAYARTDRYYLKEFEAESNFVSYVVLDVSESMAYRGPAGAQSKLDYAVRLAAALAYVVLQQRDSVGLVTFDRAVRSWLRASSAPAHLHALLAALPRVTTHERTACGEVLAELADRLPRRGVILLISDCFAEFDAFLRALARLRRRGHTVVMAQVLDAAELDLPFTDPTRLHGLEAGPIVSIEPANVRGAYRAAFAAFLERLQHGCRAHGVEHWLARTDRPLSGLLARKLARRGATRPGMA